MRHPQVGQTLIVFYMFKINLRILIYGISKINKFFGKKLDTKVKHRSLTIDRCCYTLNKMKGNNVWKIGWL